MNRSNPNMVIIDMFSCSHLLPTVMKVLASPSMNLNPQQDGSSIIIPVPQYVFFKFIFKYVLLLKVLFHIQSFCFIIIIIGKYIYLLL